MQRTVRFTNAIFPPDQLRACTSKLVSDHGDEPRYTSLAVRGRQGDSWEFDDPEDFLAEYRDALTSSRLFSATYGVNVVVVGKDHHLSGGRFVARVRVSVLGTDATVEVEGSTRTVVNQIMSLFQDRAVSVEVEVPATQEELPEPTQPRPVIFIGHGRNMQWRDLKDHLTEQHGYQVEAYETGARAGHVIRDILGELMAASSFAVLVMTGEDETVDGGLRARQNVVHEIGLFQGRIGFSRAIVLVEEGVEVFSNLQGIEQVRYSKGNIRETFGSVLATLRREFDDRR